MSPRFRRFPQSLNDVATVAFGDKDDNILTDAAIILSELQKLNRNQLDVKLVDVDDFSGLEIARVRGRVDSKSGRGAGSATSNRGIPPS